MPDGKPCTYTSILLHLLYTEPVAQQKCIAFSIYTKISSPFLHSHCFLPVFAFCSVHRHSLLPDANFNRSIHWLMGNNRLLSISTLGRKSRLILGILWPPQVSAMASTHPSLHRPVSHFFSLLLALRHCHSRLFILFLTCFALSSPGIGEFNQTVLLP